MIDPCDPNPCQNDGTCADLGGGDFLCFCNDGFRGTHCEEGTVYTLSTIIQLRNSKFIWGAHNWKSYGKLQLIQFLCNTQVGVT